MPAHLMVKVEFDTKTVIDARIFSSPSVTCRLGRETWLEVRSMPLPYDAAYKRMVEHVKADPTLEWLRPWILQHDAEGQALIGKVFTAQGPVDPKEG